MSVEKKFVPRFQLFSPVDLGKDWFIFYYEGGKRKKVKGGINRHHTFDERMASAFALKEKLESEYQAPKPVREKMLDWVEENRGRWRRKSYQTFRSKIDCLLRWAKGREISAELLRAFFCELAKAKHKQTYRAYFAVLQRIFKEIGEPELLGGVGRLSATSTPAKYFQAHQIARIKKRLLEVDHSLWLACQFIYFCFIRPGELRLLKIGDIDFDDWKICVRSEVSKNKKQQFVPVPLAFRPALKSLAERAPNEFVFFKNDCTKPLPVNGLLNRFRKVLTELGFGSEHKLYSWKHTGAVACVRAGTSLKELQIQLRHHSLEEVDKYIRQLGVNDLQDLENKFPAI